MNTRSLSFRILIMSPLILGILNYPFSSDSSTTSGVVSKTLIYKIDPNQSQWMIHTGTSGLLAGMGHKLNIAINDYSGTIRFTPDDPDTASLEIIIKSDSLSVTDKIAEKDKQEIKDNMKEKVLDIKSYPEIIFKSTKVISQKNMGDNFEIQIQGDLTLHGVTKNISIPANVLLHENRLITHGEFQIKQSDFGIKLFSAAGGTIKVKNELKLSFNLVAHP
jgi:polyisoprenoid-binding protein YceI